MRIGVLGGGQLGRMLALGGYPLGVNFRFFDPDPEATAGRVAELVTGSYEDPTLLAHFAEGLDVVTYEFENVPLEVAEWLSARVPVLPPPAALRVSQDRLVEKETLARLGIPTAAFAAVSSRAELDAAIARLGMPAVLKTRRMGYDGKGQIVIRAATDAEAAWKTLGGTPLILEGFVTFQRELSLLAVRGRGAAKETAFYPLVENHHRDGILRMSVAPAAGVSEALQRRAEDYARAILDDTAYVGVLAIELFDSESGLTANEIAPRVHNSGHWTIEGARTSQFENHVRAVSGLPLGATGLRGSSVMLNVIGRAPQPEQVLAVPSAHLHLYGKAERAGRKLGHVTLNGPDRVALNAQAEKVAVLLAAAETKDSADHPSAAEPSAYAF